MSMTIAESSESRQESTPNVLSSMKSSALGERKSAVTGA